MVSESSLLKLECQPETIDTLATQLESFGALDGEADWLVSSIWLSCRDASYLAMPATKVLPDGYVSHPLAIDQIDDFVAGIKSRIPDISRRLRAQGSVVDVPEVTRPERPVLLESVPAGPYSMDVVIRVAAGRSETHRIACGLLFGFESARLLIGTDPAVPAMVLAADSSIIEPYVEACEILSATDYLERFGG